METRAPYVLIGLFVVAAIGAVFGFVYWMHNTGGLGERAIYRIRFETSVSGVLIGSAVMFNGIKTGEVTDLKINPDNPHQVIATISVSPSTPVRADTQAGLDIQGLTGIAVVSLTGGNPNAPAFEKNGGEPPMLIADPMSWQSMTQAARTALQRVDNIMADNSESLKSALANLNTFSDALARNSSRIDGIVAGLERMTGGATANAPRYMLDLVAPRSFPAIDKKRDKQLVVADPTSVLMYESRKIVVVPAADDAAFGNTQWSDNLPKLVQAKLVQSFENANYFAAIGRPNEDLNADYKLLIDIRSFRVVTQAPSSVDVELAARIVDGGGKVVASKIFKETLPLAAVEPPAAFAALNEAFGKIAIGVVTWAAAVI
jgi:phospholipid/cholesterol/gamma-HCH transport system substrate-binding protein